MQSDKFFWFFMNAIDIAKWMDDKDHRLIDCLEKPQEHGFSNQNDFLTELTRIAKEIKNSQTQGWNEINIARCLKGLKGLSAIPKVRALLAALTTKIKASNAILGAQAIGNALYGLQNMALIPKTSEIYWPH